MGRHAVVGEGPENPLRGRERHRSQRQIALGGQIEGLPLDPRRQDSVQMLDDPRALSLPQGLTHEHEAVPGATRADEADRKVQGVGPVAENTRAHLPH